MAIKVQSYSEFFSMKSSLQICVVSQKQVNLVVMYSISFLNPAFYTRSCMLLWIILPLLVLAGGIAAFWWFGEFFSLLCPYRNIERGFSRSATSLKS